MQRTFSRGHTARRWQNWGLTPVLFNSSALSNLSVTSPKHNNFIFKIGPRTVSPCPDCYHLVQAPTMSCQNCCSCFCSSSQHQECTFLSLLCSGASSGFPSHSAKAKSLPGLQDSHWLYSWLVCPVLQAQSWFLKPTQPTFHFYPQPRMLSPRHLQGSPPSGSLLKCHLERISDAQYPI